MQLNSRSAQDLPGYTPLRRVIFRAGLCLAIALAAFLFTQAPLYAQTESGTLTGTVADSAGAVVPGAEVIVKNTATGGTRKNQFPMAPESSPHSGVAAGPPTPGGRDGEGL